MAITFINLKLGGIKKLKKLLKKIITLTLITVIALQNCLVSFAQEKNNQELNEITVEQLSNILKNDQYVKAVYVDGNKIEYETITGDKGKYEFSQLGGIQRIEIIENGKNATIEINKNSDTVFMNGQKVEIENSEEFVNVPVVCSSEWTYRSTYHPNIKAEEQIRNMLASSLLAIMVLAVSSKVATLSLAVDLIGKCADISSSTKTIYVTRVVYTADNGYDMKYIDKFYASSNYSSNYLKSKTTYIY